MDHFQWSLGLVCSLGLGFILFWESTYFSDQKKEGEQATQCAQTSRPFSTGHIQFTVPRAAIFFLMISAAYSIPPPALLNKPPSLLEVYFRFPIDGSYLLVAPSPLSSSCRA